MRHRPCRSPSPAALQPCTRVVSTGTAQPEQTRVREQCGMRMATSALVEIRSFNASAMTGKTRSAGAPTVRALSVIAKSIMRPD